MNQTEFIYFSKHFRELQSSAVNQIQNKDTSGDFAGENAVSLKKKVSLTSRTLPLLALIQWWSAMFHYHLYEIH